MLVKYLQEIGLSDKESAVYIALLQVDNDSVLDLSRKTKINRTTIYPVLESLAKKGLISEVKIDNKVRFQAQSPERLETYIEQQRVNLEESAKRLHSDIVPQLKSVQREQGERPVVKYFEGKEGVLNASAEFFNDEEAGGVQYMIYPRDLVEKKFERSAREPYINLRKKRQITAKAIYTNSKGDLPENSLSTRIRIDEKKYPLATDLSIHNDKVKITILGERLSGIIVYSKDLAQTLTSVINYVFDLQSQLKEKNK